MPESITPIEIFEKKSELILDGTIVLDRNLILPFPLSRSTAGPGVGSHGLILGFHGTRVKLQASRKEGESIFKLIPMKGGELEDSEKGPGRRADNRIFTVQKHSKVFLEKVTLIPTVMHAPEQAFINIDARCKFGCLFCTSPLIKNYRRLTNERWIHRIREAASKGKVNAIAITSGIPNSEEENIADFVTILEGVGELELPMGVEPYVENSDQIRMLREAGATELKLNIQSWDQNIFKLVCPDLDQDNILAMLEHGVKTFGKNLVTSNIIIGFGERDDNVLDGVETLAGMGVAATIRSLHLNPINEPRLRRVVRLSEITPMRLLSLQKRQRKIFQDNGIKPQQFKSMCFPCKGCDLEPF